MCVCVSVCILMIPPITPYMDSFRGMYVRMCMCVCVSVCILMIPPGALLLLIWTVFLVYVYVYVYVCVYLDGLIASSYVRFRGMYACMYVYLDDFPGTLLLLILTVFVVCMHVCMCILMISLAPYCSLY